MKCFTVFLDAFMNVEVEIELIIAVGPLSISLLE